MTCKRLVMIDALINQKSMFEKSKTEFYLFRHPTSVSLTSLDSYLKTVYQYIGVEISYYLVYYVSTYYIVY